jgi:Protein of unknown function (DUF3152)
VSAATVAAVSTAMVLLGWVVALPVDAPEPPAVPDLAGHVTAVSSSPSFARAASRQATPTATPAPDEVAIPATGTGDFAVASGDGAVAGDGDLVRYTVEVEDGLPFDPQQVAGIVDATLADPRSWIATGKHAFQRTSTEGDVRVLFATPATTDELCAPLQTRGEVSCRNRELVVINAKPWHHGVQAYRTDVDEYRRYVINHEMGHAIGFGHTGCPGPGATAPVMLQQSYGLDGCTANPWPYP